MYYYPDEGHDVADVDSEMRDTPTLVQNRPHAVSGVRLGHQISDVPAKQ